MFQLTIVPGYFKKNSYLAQASLNASSDSAQLGFHKSKVIKIVFRHQLPTFSFCRCNLKFCTNKEEFILQHNKGVSPSLEQHGTTPSAHVS